MILALGDCNIVGANSFKGKNYVDLVSEALKSEALNLGITMSTTREGKILFDEYRDKSPQILIIAYGLVDSWKTFRFAPYVLYYPDNVLRKIARKVVKKYKKIARKLGLNELLGQKYVVAPKEYVNNIEYMVKPSKRVFLIETPPHLVETFRNPDIAYYNSLLQEIAKRHEHAEVINIYEDFAKDNSLYLDEIHLNQKGYDLVAKKILERV